MLDTHCMKIKMYKQDEATKGRSEGISQPIPKVTNLFRPLFFSPVALPFWAAEVEGCLESSPPRPSRLGLYFGCAANSNAHSVPTMLKVAAVQR